MSQAIPKNGETISVSQAVLALQSGQMRAISLLEDLEREVLASVSGLAGDKSISPLQNMDMLAQILCDCCNLAGRMAERLEDNPKLEVSDLEGVVKLEFFQRKLSLEDQGEINGNGVTLLNEMFEDPKKIEN